MFSFNTLVRIYLKRFNTTIENIRTQSEGLQERELSKILASSFFQELDRQAFIDSKPTYYKDYLEDINARLERKTGRFKNISIFAKTAGTSGQDSKYIPTSKSFLRRNHVNAGWLTMSIMYALRPGIDTISRKNLLVGGAIYDRNSDYTIADISGLLIEKIPKIFHPYYVPSIAEATMPDWEKKLKVTGEKAALTDEVVMFAGVPTWILTLAKEVLQNSGKQNLMEVWPHLKVYLHGGVKIEPYMSQFEQLMPPYSNVLYLEIYNASEGFFAIQDTIENNGLLLLTQHGIYYEFIPVVDYKTSNYQILSLSEIKLGEEYVLLITTLSGLSRYVVGDTISFTSMRPFRIKVNGRINEYINAFGEDLSLENVTAAMAETCAEYNVQIRNFTVAPQYISLCQNGCHQWFVEFEKAPFDLDNFKNILDQKIQNYNFNYKQKRTDNLALSELEVIELPQGFYDNFAKRRNKFGGQNKLPKLRNDRKLAEEILEELKSASSEEQIHYDSRVV